MLVLFMDEPQMGLVVLVLLVLADDRTGGIAKVAHAATVANPLRVDVHRESAMAAENRDSVPCASVPQ